MVKIRNSNLSYADVRYLTPENLKVFKNVPKLWRLVYDAMISETFEIKKMMAHSMYLTLAKPEVVPSFDHVKK
jgi:hypothetical protein